MKLIIFFLFSSFVFVPSVFAHCGTCGKGDSHKAAAATCEKGEDGKCVECKKDKDGKCVKCKKDKDSKCAECKKGKRDCGDKVKKQSEPAAHQQKSDQPKKPTPAKAPQGQQTTGATKHTLSLIHISEPTRPY